MFDLAAALCGFSAQSLEENQTRPSRYQGLCGGTCEMIGYSGLVE